MMAGRVLTKLKQRYPYLEVEEIDVVAHPVQAWNDNIRMIPALKSGNKILSGVFLKEAKIRDFIEGL